jgi:dihydroorotate dehydrogenase (NAD+) catalytic subunit
MGLGGIRTASDAIEFILAGASAVAVGTASFIEPCSAIKIIDGIKNYCIHKGIKNIRELIGSLKV